MLHNEDDTTRPLSADGALERLFEMAVLLTDLMNQDLATEGLTPARAEVVWLVNLHGPLTQRALSQTLKCTPRNVTGLVDALQDLGLVTRNPHPTDRRATLVTLTPQGQQIAASWNNRHHDGATELFNGITQTDLATFTAVLDQVIQRLRQVRR